jgi:hypothetical protein
LNLAWADFQVRYLTAQLTAITQQNPIIVPATITNTVLNSAITNLTTALSNMAYTPKGLGGKPIAVTAANDPARYAAQQGAGMLYSSTALTDIAALNTALGTLFVTADNAVNTLAATLNSPATNPDAQAALAQAYTTATTIPTTPTGNTSTVAQLSITALNTVNALVANNTTAQGLALAPAGSTLYSATAKTQKPLYVAATAKAPNHPDTANLTKAITSVITPIATLITNLQNADNTVLTDITNLSATPATVTRAKATALGNQYTKDMAALAAAITAMTGTQPTQQVAQIIANQLPRAALPQTVTLPAGTALSQTLYNSTVPHPDSAVLTAVIKALK